MEKDLREVEVAFGNIKLHFLGYDSDVVFAEAEKDLRKGKVVLETFGGKLEVDLVKVEV